MFKEMLDRAETYFQDTVEFTDKVVCLLQKRDYGNTFLLGAIYLTLRQILESARPLGMVYTRITPIQLSTTPVRIIEKEGDGRLRKVGIGIDSAVGGPTPTIRFGHSSVSAGNGGIRLNAGVVTELGEVAPDTELWAASSTAIAAYTIERA